MDIEEIIEDKIEDNLRKQDLKKSKTWLASQDLCEMPVRIFVVDTSCLSRYVYTLFVLTNVTSATISTVNFTN